MTAGAVDAAADVAGAREAWGHEIAQRAFMGYFLSGLLNEFLRATLPPFDLGGRLKKRSFHNSHRRRVLSHATACQVQYLGDVQAAPTALHESLSQGLGWPIPS